LHTVDLKRQTVLVLDRTIGELVEYRVDSGSLVGRTVLPELVDATGLHRLNGVVVAFFSNGRVVSRQGSEFVVDSGFPDGEPEWTDCGPLWCLYTPGFLAITLVDKASGMPVDAGEILELAIHTEAGIVGIGQAFGYQDRRTVSLFDSVTGRAQQLRGWFPVGQRIDARVVSWRGPLILTSAAPLRTFIAVLDRTGMRVVGSVPYEHLDRCAATSYLVACRIGPDTVKVWQPS
jgi:hypothetical protein